MLFRFVNTPNNNFGNTFDSVFSNKTKEGRFNSKKLIFAWATAGESEKLLEAKEEFKKQAHKLNTTYPKRKKKLEEAVKC